MAQRLAGPSNPQLQAISIQVKDIDQRIDYLINEINRGKRDPNVTKIAGSVLSVKRGGQWAVPIRDYRAEAVAMFNYVRENVRYTRDPYNVERYSTARRTLELEIGDCDDMTILLGSLLQAVGLPIRIRVIGLKGQRVFSHVYLVVGLPPDRPASWMPLDASRPEEAGWELPASQRGLKRDYDVRDEMPR